MNSKPTKPKFTVTVGTKFTTPYEAFQDPSQPCIALTVPDICGEFLAIDTEGIECMFCVAMISEIYE